MARLIDESFEGTGYEESWTETIGSGNTVNEDASIPGTAPPGAGSQSLRCVLAGTNGNAYSTRASLSSQTVVYVRAYIYIDSADTSDTNEERIIAVKGFVNNLMVDYRYTPSNSHHLIFRHYDSGEQNDGFTTINLDQWYRYEGRYDSSANAWEHRIDGVTQNSGSITTPRTDSTDLIIGPHEGARTGATDIYFDLVAWADDDWIGAESTGTDVNCALETLSITTYPASVESDSTINVNLETLNITTYPASIESNNINANFENLGITTYPASVESDNAINVNTTALNITTYPAGIAQDNTIQANSASLGITTYPASIEIGSQTVVNVDTVPLNITTYPVTIAQDNTINATFASLGITTYPASVIAGNQSTGDVFPFPSHITNKIIFDSHISLRLEFDSHIVKKLDFR
jgi:hypothetical protein